MWLSDLDQSDHHHCHHHHHRPHHHHHHQHLIIIISINMNIVCRRGIRSVGVAATTILIPFVSNQQPAHLVIIIMVFRQIPHMTKSHHGGNMSLIGEVGFCHRHIPTSDNYDDEVGLGVFVDL